VSGPGVVPARGLDARASGLMLVLCLAWGLTQIATKLALAGIPPVLQAGLRSAVAGALLLAWCAARRVRMTAPRAALLPGLLIGVIFAVEFVAIFEGLTRTTAARAVVFLYVAPFVVAVGTHLFVPGDRLNRDTLLGLLAAFAGLAIAFGDSLRLPSAREFEGDMLCLLGAVLWGATTVLIKATRLAVTRFETVLMFQLGVSALLLVPASALMGESWRLELTAPVLLGFLYNAVGVAFVSYTVWFWLVMHYPASRLAAFTFLAPVFGVVAGALALGDPLSPGLIAALGLIAFGIWLVNRPRRAAA